VRFDADGFITGTKNITDCIRVKPGGAAHNDTCNGDPLRVMRCPIAIQGEAYAEAAKVLLNDETALD